MGIMTPLEKKAAEPLVRGRVAVASREWVQPVGVLHRIQAPREARVVKGIQEDPVEAVG
jgi:hypothetical protein